MTLTSHKKEIIDRFIKNVKGRVVDISKANKNHDGKEGHWLETQMDIRHNADNLPDIYGFEMKNTTSSKTTFGDWSADYYIFRDKDYEISRDDFMKIFGSPNPLKNNRYSWSGKPCPKIKKYNEFGQRIIINKSNDIIAEYSYVKDKRPNKVNIIPKDMQRGNLILAKWNFTSIKEKVENKFNMEGWFKCLKDKNGVYTNIVFGNPITFELWIEGVKKGLIYLDSGMYIGNSRNYSQWRADNKYWDSLITERY